MTRVSKLFAFGALVAFLGASSADFAQSSNTPQKWLNQNQKAADSTPSGLLASAQAAMDRNDFAAAAQSYRDYLAKNPDDAYAHFQLGYACAALKLPTEARTEFEKAIALDPNMAQAQFNLGVLLLDTDPAGALAPLQKAAELNPEDIRPKVLLGLAYERAGNYAAAIDQYRAAEKLDDKNFDVHLALGRTLLNANRPSEAAPEFRAASGLQPAAGEAHLGLAKALLAEKKPEPAVSELEKYLSGHPDDSGTRVELASILSSTGKYQEAIDQLDRAATGTPETLAALQLRGQANFQLKRYDDAIAALEKASALAPGNADTHAQLGHLYMQKKSYPEAVRELSAAWKIEPKANDVLGELVTAEYLSKNYAATVKGLDILSEREPMPASSWFVRADCYDKMGQPAPALEAYQKFLSLNKDETSDMYFEATARVRALARQLKDKKR